MKSLPTMGAADAPVFTLSVCVISTVWGRFRIYGRVNATAIISLSPTTRDNTFSNLGTTYVTNGFSSLYFPFCSLGFVYIGTKSFRLVQMNLNTFIQAWCIQSKLVYVVSLVIDKDQRVRIKSLLKSQQSFSNKLLCGPLKSIIITTLVFKKEMINKTFQTNHIPSGSEHIFTLCSIRTASQLLSVFSSMPVGSSTQTMRWVVVSHIAWVNADPPSVAWWYQDRHVYICRKDRTKARLLAVVNLFDLWRLSYPKHNSNKIISI